MFILLRGAANQKEASLNGDALKNASFRQRMEMIFKRESCKATRVEFK